MLVDGIAVLIWYTAKRALLYAEQKVHFTMFFYQAAPASPTPPSKTSGNYYSIELLFKKCSPFNSPFLVAPLLISMQYLIDLVVVS